MTEAVRALLFYFAYVGGAMLLALPLSPATLLAAKSAPPWAVAIVGAAAAGATAVFDYAVVRKAKRMRDEPGGWLSRLASRIGNSRLARGPSGENVYAKYMRWVYAWVERLAKTAPFLTTGFFAGFPMPFWIVRLVMPLSDYPFSRYVVAVMLGRFGRIFVIATFGTFVDIPREYLVALIVAGVVVAAIGGVVRHVRGRAAKSVEAVVPPPTSGA